MTSAASKLEPPFAVLEIKGVREAEGERERESQSGCEREKRADWPPVKLAGSSLISAPINGAVVSPGKGSAHNEAELGLNLRRNVDAARQRGSNFHRTIKPPGPHLVSSVAWLL